LATQEATGAERGAAEGTVGREGLERVVGAAGGEAAAAAWAAEGVEGRGEDELVAADAEDEQAREGPGRWARGRAAEHGRGARLG
jgi:hypothetical protein